MKTFAIAFGLSLIGTLVHSETPDAKDPVDQAIQRALPYLEEEGTWWIEKKECASCHHTTFLTWAGDLALEAGFELNEKRLTEQRDWLWQSFLEKIEPDPKNPENGPDPDEVNGDRNVEGVSQFLISPSAGKIPETAVNALQEIVRSNRSSEGHWNPGGQLPRQDRPERETQWVSNQWAELALARGEQEPIRTIETWAEGVPAVSSEWWMLNLLLRPENPHTLKNLLERQNADGGWSWKDGESSDPSGTGQALIALGRSGTAAREIDAVRKAQAYLVETQTSEGHWITQSTKDRDESTRVSNFWGTAWAVIGLLESQRSLR